MMPRRRLPGRLTAPTRPRGLVLLLAALAALLLCGGAPRSAAAVTPSPADWRDITIYQLLTDRFYDGVPANDNAEGAYQPATGNRTHGGDFAGLAQKLDYLQGLGVGAVWISPVYLNAFGEYHGYAARDFYAVSSQFGGLTALQSFVNAAHARGIYVVIDIVLNHTGSAHPWFNREGLFGDGGAFCDPASPTRRFYVFDEWPARYRSWLGHAHLPRLNLADPALRDLLFLDESVYVGRALDELAMAAHHTGRHAEAARIAKALLAGGKVPSGERTRLERVLALSQQAAGTGQG